MFRTHNTLKTEIFLRKRVVSSFIVSLFLPHTHAHTYKGLFQIISILYAHVCGCEDSMKHETMKQKESPTLHRQSSIASREVRRTD